MLSVIKSIALQGLNGILVRIEVDISSGLPSWDIIGLPDISIKESKERVRTSIKNCGINLLSRKYVINLSPANIRKQGSIFDLAMAIGILQASNELPEDLKLSDTIFIGELSLDGKVEGVNGVLPMCIEALRFGIKKVIVPKKNVLEASCVSGLKVIGVNSLQETIDYLNGKIKIEEEKFDSKEIFDVKENYDVDFSEVKGQSATKRALEIAVARESQLHYDRKSTALGKTMMAKRIVTILPDLSFEEALEVTKIYSITGNNNNKSLITTRPFRSPHHTISGAGMIGRRKYT